MYHLVLFLYIDVELCTYWVSSRSARFNSYTQNTSIDWGMHSGFVPFKDFGRYLCMGISPFSV
jgi:hypothetical protein